MRPFVHGVGVPKRRSAGLTAVVAKTSAGAVVLLLAVVLVANAVSGFDWFGRVAGSVVTEAPGVRSWMNATSRLAGGGDLMDLPPGVDLVRGTGPDPATPEHEPLHTLTVRDLSAVHDDLGRGQGLGGQLGGDYGVSAGAVLVILGGRHQDNDRSPSVAITVRRSPTMSGSGASSGRAPRA